MPEKNIIMTREYQGYQLSQQQHTFETKYLDRGIQMIDSMSSRHSKVFQVRMDFRYPKEMESDGSNQDFQKTLQGFLRELARQDVIRNTWQDWSRFRVITLICIWFSWWMGTNVVVPIRCIELLKSIGRIRSVYRTSAQTGISLQSRSETEQLSAGTLRSRRYERGDDSAALVSGQGR